LFFKPSSVGHEVAQSNWLGIPGRNLEIQVLINIVVQVKLALLYLLHHRSPGEQFGNRARTEKSPVDADGSLLLYIAVAIPFSEKYFAVFHHQHNRAGNVLAFELHGHKAVQEGLDIRRRHLMGSFICFGFTRDWLRQRNRDFSVALCHRSATTKQCKQKNFQPKHWLFHEDQALPFHDCAGLKEPRSIPCASSR